MVDLPRVPLRLVTSEAPQSSVSPQQVATPYVELAQNLDKLGETAEEAAIPLAQRAGMQAVTRDDQGNIQVEQAPIFGRAALAYQRGVKMGALAEGEGEAKRADIAMRQQFRDDPQGYERAADAFRAQTVKQYTSVAGPEVGIAVGRAIDATTTQTFRGLLNEKERLDLRRADASMAAGIQSARDDAVTLARSGDTSSDAFKSAVQKIQTLTAERVNNPRLAYPQAQADYDLQQFFGDVSANGYLHHIDQVYQTAPSRAEGAKAALDQAKSILTDPSVKLTEAQRNAYYHKAVGEIHANEAIRRQDIAEARTSERELVMASALGTPVSPEDVNSVSNAYKAAGDPGSAARVYASFSRKPLNDDFGRQPLSEQTRQLNDLQGSARWGGAYNFFVSKGWSPAQAAGIIGGLRGETAGLNPTQIHDGGIGIGISGWNSDRRAALSRFAAQNGMSPTDLRTQLEFVDHELRTTEAASGERLKGALTPEQAGQVMLGYFRPSGFDQPGAHPERARYAREAFDQFSGQPGAPIKVADASGGPGAALWLQANRARTVDQHATAAWQTMFKDWTEKGIRPNDQAIGQVIDAARATNDHGLLEQISFGMSRMDLAQQQAGASLPEQQQAITALRSAGTTGTLGPGQAAVLNDLQRRYSAITSGLKDNPISTAVQNFPDKFKALPPLDLNDPNNLVAGLKARGQVAQFAAANWQTGPLSALDAADLNQVKAVADGNDPVAKTRVFSALATLPEDVRNATLKKLAEKGGPSMAVSVAAGAMLHDAPEVATSIMRGQQALKTDKAYWPNAGAEAAALNKVLPPTTFGMAARTDPSGPYATALGMVKARYADLSAAAGDVSGKLNDGRMTQAVTDVTGGVLSHNGATLIAPQRGMAQTDFDRVMNGLNDTDIAGATTLNGQPVTADYIRSNAQLESVGQGRYLVRLGRDPAKPIYAYTGANTEAPQKFVLDLRNRAMGDAQPNAMQGAILTGVVP